MRKRNETGKVDLSIMRICENASGRRQLLSAIVFVDEKSKEKLAEELGKLDCMIKYELDLINAFAVEVYADSIDRLAEDERVLYITGDVDCTTCLDIARGAIGADDINYSGEGIGVALVDTGVYPHSDLTLRSNRLVAFADFVQGKKRAYDDNGHGTHCAGIVASDGSSSGGRYRGIAPKANIIGLKVMDQNGMGSASDILAAMEWINRNREVYNIRIASLSLGASAAGRNMYDPLVAAANKLWDNGVVVVAAAGNEGPEASTIGSPGVSRKIITVGCSDDNNTVPVNDDFIADFSSRGPSPYSRNKPDIVAPGVDIMSLSNAGGYVHMSGTSMATPIISGCCALLLEKNPSLTPDAVKQKLNRSVVSLGSPRSAQGNGLIDVKRLLS